MSDRVTVPRSLGFTPGPATGVPLVSSAGQSTASQGGPRTLVPSLHAKGSALVVSASSLSDVRTYSEQPAKSAEPCTNAVPKGVEATDTTAGAEGALFVDAAQL